MKQIKRARIGPSGRGNHRRVLAVLAVAIAAGMGNPRSARADKFWKAGVTTGNWSNGNNWSAVSATGGDNAGAPVSNDIVRILNNDALSHTVTLDTTPPNLSAIVIGNSGSGSDTLIQNSTFNITVTAELMGPTSIGGVGKHVQSAGNNSITSDLDVGDDGGSICEYDLSNSAVLQLAGTGGGITGFFVGDDGTGTFNQSGGTVNASVQTIVGNASDGVGKYILSAGSLNVTGANLTIGSSGSGTFIQSGGVATIGTTTVNQNLFLGLTANSGIYTLTNSNSQLTVNGNAYIGGSASASGGTGVLNIGAGTTSTVTGTLKVWNSSNSQVNLATGGTLNVGTLDTSGNPTLFLGNGTTTGWTGGTLNMTGVNGLTLGSGGPLSSTLTIGAGKALGVTNTLNVSGTLNLTGGTVSAGTLVTSNPSQLNWSTGTLNITGTNGLTIGGGGPLGANLNVTAPRTLGVTNTLAVTSGVLNVSGGAISTGTLSVGSAGTVTHSSGTVTAGSVQIYSVGSQAANWSGSTVTLGYRYPDQSTVYTGFASSPVTFQVNNTQEVSNWSDNRNADFTVSSNSILVSFSGGGGWREAAFNGWAISDAGDGVAPIVGVSIDASTNYPGLTASDISFDNNDVYVNWQGTSFTGSSFLKLDLTFASALGIYNLAGGTLTTGSINTNGTPTGFNWTTGTLNLTASSLTVGSGGPLGSNLTLNTGQNLNITGSGQSLNLTGTLNINGGGLSVPTINQTAGTFTNTGTLTLAGTGGNAAAYNLSAGTLSTAALSLGSGGTFGWTGGTLNITGAAGLTIDSVGTNPFGSSLTIAGGRSLGVSNTLYIGNTAGSTGALTLSTGNLTVATTGQASLTHEIIGYQGTGSFIQSGGNNTVGTTAAFQSFFVGDLSSGVGSYTMNSDAASLTVYGYEYIGYESTGTSSGGTITQYGGTFNQSAGTNTLSIGQLQIGGDVGGTGAYLLSGTGALISSVVEAVGFAGTGSFTQTGGTNTVGTPAVNANLDVGISATGSGNYLMQGAGSIVTVNGNEIVGAFSPGTSSGGIINQYGGTFTQTNGTHTVTGSLDLGRSAGGTGAFILSGGTLSVASAGTAFSTNEYIGDAGTGNFTQSGGTHTIGTAAVNQNLILGNAAGGVGSYTMNNAAASLTVNGNEYASFNATGIRSGGTITQYGGIFTQSAGTHTVTGELQLAVGTNSTASFILSGGTLAVMTTSPAFTSAEYIGLGGTGSFTQSGGTHTVGTAAANQELSIGVLASAIGSYTMNDATAALIVYGYESVGGNSTGSISGGTITQYGGTFNQSAGSHTITSTLLVGYSSGGTGAFNLSGGNLAVALGESIGLAGTGSFTQSGGINTIGKPGDISDNLYIGRMPSAIGTYTLNNASAALTVNGNEYIGGTDTATGGAGVMNISNGTATVAGTLKLWNTPGTALNITGGTLNVDTLNSGSSTGATVGGTGTVNVASSVTVLSGSALTINSGGAVNLLPHAGNNNVNILAALNINGTGLLDVANNDLIIQGTTSSVAATNLTASYNELKAGFNAGHGYWDGSSGIISTRAKIDAPFLTTLGYRQSTGSTFDGTPTTTNDVLVKYTYYGDADLNGTVDGADYQQIDLGFGGNLTGWQSGDFNYDGLVNGSDFALIDNTFNQLTAAGVGSLAIIANPTNLIAGPTATSAIPEPAALGMFGAASLGFLGRRRHRR